MKTFLSLAISSSTLSHVELQHFHHLNLIYFLSDNHFLQPCSLLPHTSSNLLTLQFIAHTALSFFLTPFISPLPSLARLNFVVNHKCLHNLSIFLYPFLISLNLLDYKTHKVKFFLPLQSLSFSSMILVSTALKH